MIPTSIFAFATDLHDEGVGEVFGTVSQRGGIGGITVAAAYHHGRDIFPHNPARKVRFLEGGAIFFRPTPASFDGLIQPRVASLAQEHDIFRDARREADRRSMSLNAWVVFLHNTALATAYPSCAVRNAFDDVYLTDLCPSNPEVRRYAVNLASDLMKYRPDGVVAESLHFHSLEHGYHHERYFVDLGATARYLLGLCFCQHCLARAAQRGVDAEAIQVAARTRIQEAFDAPPSDAGTFDVVQEEMEHLFETLLGDYLAMRTDAVSTLASDVAAAVDSAGGRFTFMDLSGAVKGYANGRPEGPPVSTHAWRLGVDIADLAEVCHTIQALGYAYDPDRLRADLSRYLEATQGSSDLAVVLRPMQPDCDSIENLASKLAMCADLGLARADFYHYGFMRLSTLDWVHGALNN